MADEDLPLDPDLVADLGAPSRSAVLAAVGAGGMIGATLRYKLATWVPVAPGTFPWATFWANVSGSLVLGFLLVVLIERYPPARYARAFAATGVIGAYTTFSTFSVETDLLVRDGHVATAVAYVAASVVVGLGAAWLGLAAARKVVRGA